MSYTATPSTKAESEIAGYIICDSATGEPRTPELRGVSEWGETIEVALTRRGAAQMLIDNEHGDKCCDLRPVTIKLAPFVPDQHHCCHRDAAETATAAKLAELTDLYAVYLDDGEPGFKRSPIVNHPEGADDDAILDVCVGYKNAVHLAAQYADCCPRIVPIHIVLDGSGKARIQRSTASA